MDLKGGSEVFNPQKGLDVWVFGKPIYPVNGQTRGDI